jgi:hypothetical protein
VTNNTRTVALWLSLLAVVYFVWSTATPHTALQVWGGVAAIAIGGLIISRALHWLTSRPASPEVMRAMQLVTEQSCKRCGIPRTLGTLWCRRCYGWIDNAVAIALFLGLLGAAGALWWSLR